MIRAEKIDETAASLAKAQTGIPGLDEITRGGLPAGRPTLIYGGPGCGKTILAMEFLVHGAQDLDEPGLFVSFEETEAQLLENFSSFGFGLEELIEKKKLKISYVELSRGEIVEAGAFSLDGLLIRLQHGIVEIGAKRVVLDSLETLFSSLSINERLRNEVARLFRWLRDAGVTAIITGERGQEQFTRHGFEDYVSDCVLLLDHRTVGQISKRRMRIIKYRGSGHATNEFPFLIGETGLSVVPITSIDLGHRACSERVSTGVKDLDEMLGGEGYFKSTTALITGRSGTGKSSLAAAFALAACERGERCLYFSFEESASQVVRNMRSLGMDLEPWVEQGLLAIRSFRPTFRGLEEHLVSVAEQTSLFDPTCVVMDPTTNFVTVGDEEEVKSMLTRILDLLKRRGTTLVMTALTAGVGTPDQTENPLSSLVDTWIVVDLELRGNVRHRAIHVVKSRGMEHSHEMRELLMSSRGLSIRGAKEKEQS
jgi:circadian clock protein KaiC